MSHKWRKIPWLFFQFTKKETLTHTHTVVLPINPGDISSFHLSHRFHSFHLCSLWRADWSWNSLCWTQQGRILCSAHCICHTDIFYQGQPHKDCFRILKNPTHTWPWSSAWLGISVQVRLRGGFQGCYQGDTKQVYPPKGCFCSMMWGYHTTAYIEGIQMNSAGDKCPCRCSKHALVCFNKKPNNT